MVSTVLVGAFGSIIADTSIGGEVASSCLVFGDRPVRKDSQGHSLAVSQKQQCRCMNAGLSHIILKISRTRGRTSLLEASVNVFWRVPNPPGANPVVAERAFPTSDYWGLTRVARCAEEMTGICRDFQQAADPLPHQTAKTSKGPFQLPWG